MDADFGFQIAENARAGNRDRRVFDARLHVRQNIDDLRVVIVAFGPAQIHPQEHIRPILRLCAARARVNRENRVALIEIAAQHLLRFDFVRIAPQFVDDRLDFGKHGFVPFLAQFD